MHLEKGEERGGRNRCCPAPLARAGVERSGAGAWKRGGWARQLERGETQMGSSATSAWALGGTPPKPVLLGLFCQSVSIKRESL